MKIEYFLVLAVTIAGPLFFSFSPELRFHRSPRRLLLAIGFPFPVFILWDVIATARGHWSFNPEYVTGLMLYNLPLEEVLFFIVVPFAALFTWESVNWFLRRKP
jgi:lycopene cyclase domain-containing protein